MHATMQKTAQDMAKGFDAVTASIKEMQSAMAKGMSGAGSGSGNSITKYISQIKHAMSEMKTAYANVNKSVGIGDTSQESYWRNQAKLLTQQTEGIFSNLNEAVNRSVSGMTKYGDTVRNLYQQFKLLGSVQGNRDANKTQADSVQRIKDAYDDLVRSIREYNAQIKNNDLTGANNTISHIGALISRYSELEKIMSSSGLSGRNLLNAESALQKMNVEAQKFFATLEASRQQTVVQQIKDAYDDLVRSIKEYNSQVESGDYANANKTKQHIDELIRSYKELEETASKSGLSEEKLREVNAILQNMRTAMNNFTKSVQDANSQVSTMDSLLQQAGERLLQMANQAILRGLSTMWREAISYTKTYYDSLNEIRIVTMRSQEEANALGAQYRENARE